MDTGNPHLDPPVIHAGAAVAHARAVAILLHGRGQNPTTVIDHIARRIALPGVAYVVPGAADHSWYPAGFMAPASDNEPRRTFALERIAQLEADLVRQGVDAEAQILIGFSQGACLACEYVYRKRRRARALIAFTGGLLGPPGTAWQGARDMFAGMPALFGGSLRDRWVPAERVYETAGVFEQLGARVTTQLYDGDSHEVSDAEIAAARALLAELGA